MYENQYQRKFEPGVEFLILIGIWVASFVIGSVASIPIWIIMTGKSIFSMQKEMFDAANINALKVIQVVSTIIIFFIPAVVTARIVSVKPFERLGFRKGVKFNRAVAAILIMLCALPLVGFLAEINKAIPITASLKKMFDTMESQYAEQVKLMATFKTPVDYIVALFIIAFMPAVVEEVFFRGAMQSIIMRWFKIPWLVIFITGLIFSAIHFSWYGFIPRLALGMILGYIFYYTGNLWYSIIAHFFNNALMISILYWQYTKEKKIDMEVGESAPWWAGIISAGIVIGLFIVLKKLSATKTEPDSIAEEPVSRPPDYLS
ncbi:MAG: CPBP family intramembrane metalloprotease [Chitinophagaceae bacterium]|nr:CPBP family intramembrane metalloprotease [Chitinophagaceae bacterium]